jgi:hypothetical protein
MLPQHPSTSRGLVRFKTRDLSANLATVVGADCLQMSGCTLTKEIQEEPPCEDPSQPPPPCEDPSEPAPQPDCTDASAPLRVSVCPDGVTLQCDGSSASSYGAAAKRAIRAQMEQAGRPAARPRRRGRR